jgi:DNA polymerase-3 subunit epsilon
VTENLASAEELADLFSRTVDGEPVNFVRPIDATSPTWVAYASARPLGTVSLEADFEAGRPGSLLWRVQSTHERYRQLAVRAMRTPGVGQTVSGSR